MVMTCVRVQRGWGVFEGGGTTSVALSERVDKLQPAELSKWKAMLSFVSIKRTLACVYVCLTVIPFFLAQHSHLAQPYILTSIHFP